MRKHDVRFDVIHNQLHILITVFPDGIAQIHHVLRLQQEIHEHVFKSHKEMQPLKDTGWHKRHHKFSLCPNLLCLSDKRLPQRRIGAVCLQIRHHQLIFPFGNIADYLIPVRHMRHGCHLTLRPQDCCPEAVLHRIHPRPAVPSDIGRRRVRREECGPLILSGKPLRFPVRFYRLQKILYRCKHFFMSSFFVLFYVNCFQFFASISF